MSWLVGSSRLPLQYRFEPGSERDGINVKVHPQGGTGPNQRRRRWVGSCRDCCTPNSWG